MMPARMPAQLDYTMARSLSDSTYTVSSIVFCGPLQILPLIFKYPALRVLVCPVIFEVKSLLK